MAEILLQFGLAFAVLTLIHSAFDVDGCPTPVTFLNSLQMILLWAYFLIK